MEKDMSFLEKKREHTPSPWEYRKTKRGYAILHPLITKTGKYKGKLGGYHVVVQERQLSPEGIETRIDKADAQLIAAAPELLEALIQCERELNNFVTVPNYMHGQLVPPPTTGMDMAQQAIAKAEKG